MRLEIEIFRQKQSCVISLAQYIFTQQNFMLFSFYSDSRFSSYVPELQSPLLIMGVPSGKELRACIMWYVCLFSFWLGPKINWAQDDFRLVLIAQYPVIAYQSFT